MAGAPQGVTVLDFGQYIAGPLAAMLLADQDAEVVRIDPPGGPRWRSPANATWNRGKRSIVLDLKQERDREAARELAASADVLIENFRPGVMDRLGLGADSLTEANPRLVYCSLPGFASDDPRRDVQAWEGVVEAAAAGYTPEHAEDGRPAPSPLRGRAGEGVRARYSAIPAASMFAAFLGATSVAMALLARERDGLGQRIEVPLFDAMFVPLGNNALRVHSSPGRFRPNELLVGRYRCGDGRWFQLVAATGGAVRGFVRALGAGEWLDAIRNHHLEQDAAKADATRRHLEALFRTRTAVEWEDAINAAGCAAAVCRTSAEWMAHEQARAAGIVVPVEDGEYGRMWQPGVAVALTPGPSPLAGRGELEARGLAAGTGLRTSEIRPVLDGVRVLDLCIVLAGPVCGRTLAEFGADVIKIDNPRRPANRTHNDVNRGKRSILLDLKTPEGLELFWRLAEDADVIVQNFRAGVVERLGIGYEQVRSRRPDIVYASINAYGHKGPWAGRPGWEQVAQAATGMQARYGGDGPPRLQPYPVTDYGTGVLAAYGIALALRQRTLTGEGQHVRASLASTATLLQSPFMQLYDGKTWDEPRGQDALGHGALQRLYEASDGWLFLGAREPDVPRLAVVEGLTGLDGVTVEERERFLEAQFAEQSAAEWVARLTVAGIGAHEVRSIPDLREDQTVRARGLVVTREHAGLGLVDTTGSAPRLSGMPVLPGAPASPPGSDLESVLADVGRGADLERLLEAEAVAVPGGLRG